MTLRANPPPHPQLSQSPAPDLDAQLNRGLGNPPLPVQPAPHSLTEPPGLQVCSLHSGQAGSSPCPSALWELIHHPRQRWRSQNKEGGIQARRACSIILATHVAAAWGGGAGADLRDLSPGQCPGAPLSPPTQARAVSLCVSQDLGFRPIRDMLFLLLPPQLLAIQDPQETDFELGDGFCL